MIKVVSVERMREIENAANDEGITFEMMFERVGSTVADRIEVLLGALPDVEPRVTILVGGGNNGGDGLEAALNLVPVEGITVGVYLVKPRPEDDPYLARLRKTEAFIAEADQDQNYRVLRNMVASSNLVVDAIAGIGLRLPLEGEITKILGAVAGALDGALNDSPEGVLVRPSQPVRERLRPYVLALDCPTGVNCDTGELDPHTIPADETITFIAVKQGLLASPAAAAVGVLNVATLGIPEAHMRADTLQFADPVTVSELVPRHNALSHKGSRGEVMIVAGSVNYTGAAGLGAQAAYRAGAGLVTVAAPMPVVAALASTMLEPTWVLLAHDMGVISEKAADKIIEEVAKYDALLVGPGLGTEDTTGDMLSKLMAAAEAKPKRPREARPIGFAGLLGNEEETSGAKDEPESVQLPPLVLDADALNLLAKVENWHEKVPVGTIITPHPGEMARLCDVETSEVQARRVEIARERAAEWNVVVVLKGAHTVVASPDGVTTVLPFKTVALATAGTGDVLAGIVVSMLGAGLAPYDAALVATYIHGSAGTLAASAAGNLTSVIASDVIEQIGMAFEGLV